MDTKNESRKMNINDVAQELGISKTTVSRAISGKGRISQKTRDRVMRYIERIGYAPSIVAQGLAQSRTFNIAFVMPNDNSAAEMPFFQKCLWGVNRNALINNYDVIVATSSAQDIVQLERLIRNQKIDGAILARTYYDDIAQKLLKESNIPFITIGKANDDMTLQIDNDNENGCRELTEYLLRTGNEKVALIGYAEKSMVDKARLLGYAKAFERLNKKCSKDYTMLVEDESTSIEAAVDVLMDRKADCIVCMDDGICSRVLNYLQIKHAKIPEDIKVASFFDSNILEHNTPGITTVRFNAEALGEKSCSLLLEAIDGNDVEAVNMQDYEIVIKESTGAEK